MGKETGEDYLDYNGETSVSEMLQNYVAKEKETGLDYDDYNGEVAVGEMVENYVATSAGIRQKQMKYWSIFIFGLLIAFVAGHFAGKKYSTHHNADLEIELM